MKKFFLCFCGVWKPELESLVKEMIVHNVSFLNVSVFLFKIFEVLLKIIFQGGLITM